LAKSKEGRASGEKEIKLLRKDIQRLSKDLHVLLKQTSAIQSMIGRSNFALDEVAKSVEKIEFRSSYLPKPKKRA
jgi:hypothetical protein